MIFDHSKYSAASSIFRPLRVVNMILKMPYVTIRMLHRLLVQRAVLFFRFFSWRSQPHRDGAYAYGNRFSIIIPARWTTCGRSAADWIERQANALEIFSNSICITWRRYWATARASGNYMHRCDFDNFLLVRTILTILHKICTHLSSALDCVTVSSTQNRQTGQRAG